MSKQSGPYHSLLAATRSSNSFFRFPRRKGNRPISVYRLGGMPIQSCGQSVSAPRGKAGVRLNAHTELRAKRQRSAQEAIYRNRPIENKHSIDVRA